MSLSSALLDNPLLLSILFHPRSDKAGSAFHPQHLRWRDPGGRRRCTWLSTLRPPGSRPVVVYFHGNGEIASDYGTIAPMYHHAGASLLVVDYRGYGWSTGQPRLSTLLSDTEFVCVALPDILVR